MTYEDKASCESSPPCTHIGTHICAQTVDKNRTMMQRNRSSAALFSQMSPIIMFCKLYITMFAQMSPTLYFHKRALYTKPWHWCWLSHCEAERSTCNFANARRPYVSECAASEPCISAADSDESYTISEVPQQLEAANAETWNDLVLTFINHLFQVFLIGSKEP